MSRPSLGAVGVMLAARYPEDWIGARAGRDRPNRCDNRGIECALATIDGEARDEAWLEDDFDHRRLPEGHPLRRAMLYRFSAQKV